MSRYLSTEWIEELDAAAAADEQLRAVTAGADLTVQQIVTGGPDGDVAYHVVADHGRVAVRPGQAAAPTVTFTQSYETATAVARGELSAQGAFMTGRIRVSGELVKLVEDGHVLAGIDDVFHEIRARTSYAT